MTSAVPRNLGEFALRALVLASLLELISLRLLSRLAMHIPADLRSSGFVVSSFDLLFSFGSFVYYLSYGGSYLALLLLVYRRLRHHRTEDLLVSFFVLLILLSSPFRAFFAPDALFSLVYDLASVAAIVILAAALFRMATKNSEKVAAVLLAASYLSYYYFKTSHAFYQLLNMISPPVLATQVFGTGEFLAVINSFVLFIAYAGLARVKKRSAALASFVTFFLIAAYLADPYATSILATWSLGLTMFLPFPVYAAAIWLFSLTVFARLGREETIGYGLALIVLAGYALALPHQVLKAVLGVSLLGLRDAL